MPDIVVSQCDIRDKADGAEIPSVTSTLVLRRQQYVGAVLRKATPRVLHDVAFHQNPLALLQFKIVLHAEFCTDELFVKWIPGKRLEHVIQPDLNVTGNNDGSGTAKHNALTGGFHEVVVRFHESSVTAIAPVLRIAAIRGRYLAMRIGHVRVDDGHVISASLGLHQMRGIGSGITMNPVAVENDVRTVKADQRVVQLSITGTRNLETNQAVVISYLD